MKADNQEQEQCPNCGRFMELDADGWYDREYRDYEESLILQFCDESCADRYQRRRRVALHVRSEQ